MCKIAVFDNDKNCSDKKLHGCNFLSLLPEKHHFTKIIAQITKICNFTKINYENYYKRITNQFRRFWLWIDPMKDIKKKRLMDAVDQITDAYGRHTITLGKAFTKDGWQMKREFLSPCVTTEINNISIVD